MSILRLRAPYAPAIVGVRGSPRVGFDLMVSPAVLPAPVPLDLTVAPGLIASAPAVDKFMDPRAQFYDPDARCRVSQPEYLLTVPPVAARRVALMREKVEEARSTGVLGRGVAPLAESSHDAISVEGKLLQLKYSALAKGELTAKEIEAFADRVGKKVDDLIRQTTPDFMSNLATVNVKEFGAAAWKVLGPQIMHEVRSVSDQVGSLAGSIGSSAGSFTDLIKAIPVISAAVTWYLDSVKRWSDLRDADWALWCRENIQKNIVDPFERTLRLGYPYPWHAWDLDLSCPEPEDVYKTSLGTIPKPTAKSKWDATPAQRNASLVMRTNLRWVLDLERNLSAAAAVTRWWTLAMQLMAFGDMRWVFQAMMVEPLTSPCNDGTMSTADACGWQVASDEQVLLVAYPIAASNGLDPWLFAEELYRRSRGWHDPDFESLLVYEPRRMWHYTDDGDIVGDPSICGTQPVNAMHVQWAVLARDAFALVDAVKRGEVPTLTPTIGGFLRAAEDSYTPSNVPWWILGLGTVASGGLYLAGASIGVSIAPLAASVLYAVTRR